MQSLEGEEDNAEPDEAENGDHDKSKRVSGQGMPRPRTPRAKRIHNVRAISTPQASKTVLGDNVTFRQDESTLDLSAITVLSPQSSINVPVSRRNSESQAGNKDDTDAVSFRFKRGGRDLFEKLVESDTGAAASGKILSLFKFLDWFHPSTFSIQVFILLAFTLFDPFIIGSGLSRNGFY